VAIKKESRQAIVHPIDCEGIVQALYQSTTTCRGNSAAPGVVSITDYNIRPYEYDPGRSQQLLEDIGYICGRPNSAAICKAEIKITSQAARNPVNTELIEFIATLLNDVGIKARANIVEVGISQETRTCGVGNPGAQIASYRGPPSFGTSCWTMGKS
jgi:ABC-type transport system substrate-binding protein